MISNTVTRSLLLISLLSSPLAYATSWECLLERVTENSAYLQMFDITFGHEKRGAREFFYFNSREQPFYQNNDVTPLGEKINDHTLTLCHCRNISFQEHHISGFCSRTL